ncbi:protein kinase domain-containing protein [Schaalia vaccimaxillae]|uniref:protein kinase domain-containing protein n=1 Tax=Schaalia vaccimaxillae TaxID=183916 RepID=UPI0003B75F29|nr:protein kinase [Schaalia vaccimaxillae]
MNINGYEFGEIAFMTAGGPLWATTADGCPALVALRSANQAQRSRQRWKAWANVDSQYVVRLIDVAQHDDGRCAIVQERVRGRTLESLLTSDELRPLATRRMIIRGLRRGLEALHEAGVVHGDLSVSNVLIDQRLSPVIIDLIDLPTDDAGTPGWTLDLSVCPSSDFVALKRIARALGIHDDDDAQETTDKDDTVKPVDEELIAKMFIDPTNAVEDLRRAAAVTPTISPQQKGRHGIKRPRKRPSIPLSLSLGLTAVAVMAATSGFTWWAQDETIDSLDLPAQSALRPQHRCSLQDAQNQLDEILRQRDLAFQSTSVDQLATVLDAELLQIDTRTIEELVASGTTLQDISTAGTVQTISSCSSQRMIVEAVIQQNRSQTCQAGQCRQWGPQQEHLVELVLEGAPIKATRMRPLA